MKDAANYAQNACVVMVTATDPSGEAGADATSEVTITVTNVDEAPSIDNDDSDANAHDFDGE